MMNRLAAAGEETATTGSGIMVAGEETVTRSGVMVAVLVRVSRERHFLNELLFLCRDIERECSSKVLW